MDLPADYEGMALFIKIVEYGSLSATDRALNLPKATLSRRLNALERRLGTTLVHRNTRSLTLTDAGRVYFERCLPIIAEAEAAEAEMRSRMAIPSGLVRLTATVSFGQYLLAPLVFAFLDRYPAVRMELEFTDRRVSLIEEGFDLAVRMGALEDSELRARRLMRVERFVVATPQYLEHSGTPTTPEELRSHRCLIVSDQPNQWRFIGSQGEVSVSVPWRLAAHGTFTIREAVLAHQGIALLPEYLLQQDIDTGKVVRLLQDFQVPSIDATALFPKSRTTAAATRTLLEFLVAHLVKPSF
jgi:DNA-binding transcriptional LysR family regulator